MKKLLAVLTMAFLLCSVLVPQVFAVEVGPSIPTGLSGITHAGFLMEGELGNDLQAKYDTNLPLGEITENFKAAPNPAGKKTVAVVAEVEEEAAEVEEIEAVEEEAAEVEGVIGEVDAIEPDFAVLMNGEVVTAFNSAVLLEMFVAEDAMIVTEAEEWIVVLEDGVVSLPFGGILIAFDAVTGINATYNGAAEVIDVDVAAGTFYIIYTFAEEVEVFSFEYAVIDAFAIANGFYASLELEEAIGTLPITLTVVLGDEIDDIVIELIEIVPEEVEEVEEEAAAE